MITCSLISMLPNFTIFQCFNVRVYVCGQYLATKKNKTKPKTLENAESISIHIRMKNYFPQQIYILLF